MDVETWWNSKSVSERRKIAHEILKNTPELNFFSVKNWRWLDEREKELLREYYKAYRILGEKKEVYRTLGEGIIKPREWRKRVSLDEMKRILDRMIATKEGTIAPQSKEWYKPLVELGILKEGEKILSDYYYDAEAVEFARKILDYIEC